MSCIDPIFGAIIPSIRSEESQSKKKEERLFSPPSLVPPNKLPPASEYRLVHLIDQLGQTKNHFLSVQANRLTALQDKIQKATEELTRKLQELSKAIQDATYWNSVKKVATSLVSALSLVAGLSALATPGMALVGGALISSGVLSIGHIAMTESKGWDQMAAKLEFENGPSKEQLRQFLPIACGVLAAACGLAGSSYAIASNALSLGGSANSVLPTTLNLLKDGTTLKAGMTESYLRYSQGSFASAETHQEMSSTKLELCNDQFQALYSHFEHVMKQARRAVQTIVKTHHTPLS